MSLKFVIPLTYHFWSGAQTYSLPYLELAATVNVLGGGFMLLPPPSYRLSSCDDIKVFDLMMLFMII
ncbi:Uncharacterized protein TCM_020873 [Theobroma cacao]|uniref:Uncharacterized protein n=1 Tax=Theobroma cacao TaxID=3641 RepID=A0A061EMD7_THECC|nr:Uncharacterized protein TCM_020873 [Theobroma cacao]